MKLRVPLLWIVCLFSIAFADEVWVRGVNAQSGWYDANKVFDGVDDDLCWAAAASNMLTWWQDRNSELSIISGAPQGNTEIWNDFVQSFGNWKKDEGEYGGNESDGFHWYLDGTIDSSYIVSEYGRTHGGYYKNLVSTVGCTEQVVADAPTSTAEQTTDAIMNALTTGCGITLGIYSSSMSHAITLWGVEYNEGAITSMYLTDSDDEQEGQHGLFKVKCVAQDMSIEVEEGKFELRNVLHIESEDVLPSGQKYYGEDVYIGDFTYLKSTLPRIPEPATGMLSLLALAVLSVRRTRFS